jgi:nucleotide-binding universal stress UspA family protein
MSEILVGIDGSAGAQDALAFAQRLAGPAGASLRLVCAFPYSDMHSRASNEAFREALRDDAQAMLDRTAASTEGAVVATDAIADVSPPHALHLLAERVGAALIVVGSTHRGPVGRVLPGSTAERLLHGSPCPVGIVPHGYAAQGADPIKTIGVAYNATDESDAALAAACKMARRLGADLRVIRVFDAMHVGTPALMTGPSYLPDYVDYEAEEREGLERAVASLPDDVSAEAVFVAGSPGAELAAKSEGVDLMVVGSRGYGPLAAVLLGGVTHTFVRKAACPVIVLPRGEHAGIDELFAEAIRAEAERTGDR